MKAQVTLEFLLLFAVLLAFLAVWISMMVDARKDMSNRLSELYKNNALYLLKQSADEICILGPGNNRSINILLMSDSIVQSSGKNVTITDQNSIMTEKTRCDVSMVRIAIKAGELTMENTNGTISVRKA